MIGLYIALALLALIVVTAVVLRVEVDNLANGDVVIWYGLYKREHIIFKNDNKVDR